MMLIKSQSIRSQRFIKDTLFTEDGSAENYFLLYLNHCLNFVDLG